jgi:multicomponent Na+:H+ antiporter subunit F
VNLGAPKLTVLYGALVAVALGAILCLIRIVRGPSPFDRVLAFDCLALDLVGAILLESMLLETDVFIDVALVVLLLGFIGTMSLATYLERHHGD